MNFKEFIGESFTDHEFKRREQNVGVENERNNLQIVINGKNWKVIVGGIDNSAEMKRNQETAKKIVATLKSKGKNASWHVTGANVT